ncbi:hypothetical protein PLICRDRAFT_34694 [Plicaturopsis crispa FD-325 SS-3]|nr:hypothetical protein PLICRDRAFT_34694 [Plicaturopsis crispa FD-325 SS-3]
MRDKQRSAPSHARADIVTYRFNDELVYVTPARDYNDAIEFARKVFPAGLRGVPRDRIALTVNVTMKGVNQPVRISQMAWPSVAERLLRYEVINIAITEPDVQLPDIIVEDTDADPPEYRPSLQSVDSKEGGNHPERRRSSPPEASTRDGGAMPYNIRHSSSDRGGLREWFVRHARV